MHNFLGGLLLAVTVILTSGCASARPAPRETAISRNSIHVTVESDSWYAKTIRIYCTRAQVGVIHGIVMSRTSREDVRIGGCTYIRFKVEGFDNSWWWSEEFMINAGDTLEIHIGPRLPLTFWWVR